MGLAQKTVNYVQEVDTLLGLLVTAINEVKAGKTPIQIGADLLPSLIGALSGLTQLGDELKNVKVVEETLGYRMGDLVAALTGAQ